MTRQNRNSASVELSASTVRLVIGCLIGIAFFPGIVLVSVAWLIAPNLGTVDFNMSALVGVVVFVFLISAGCAIVLWVKVFRNPIQSLTRTERLLRNTRLRDELTGLPNRAGLRKVLESSFKNRRGSATVGILLIDIDRFRMLNHTIGQPAGDDVLRAVGDRVRAVVRGSDLVARIDGDQFAVAVPSVANEQAMAAMARNILRAFEPGYPIGNKEATITPSIGIAISSEQASTTDALLSHAETAMRTAKDLGGHNYRIYESNMHADHQLRLDIEARLKQAVEANQLGLMYQPLVDGEDHRMVAVEALVRWNDSQLGDVSPEEFVPILEQTGQIETVGVWVLRTAMADCLEWHHGQPVEIILSVNVSPRQFANDGFVDEVLSALRDSDFPAAQLQLELTEGLLLDADEATVAKLNALVGTGLKLVLDDFGIGYSSLAYLKQFPLSGIKIDRMFISDVPYADRDTAIVRAMVDLGHGLGLRVTAEGIETTRQAEALGELRVDCLQGNLFSQPITTDGMVELVARNGALLASQEKSIPRARHRVVQHSPCECRTRVLRNGEVLLDTTKAIRLIETDSESTRTLLLVPETDLKVRLLQTETNDDSEAEGEDYLDLVGQSSQIVHEKIGKRYLAVDGQPALSGYVIFGSNDITIEESAL